MPKTPAAQLDREIAEALSGSGSRSVTLADRFMHAISTDVNDARAERTRRALDVILHGQIDGMIYGPEYKNAKDHLSRRFDEAFGAKISAPYMHGRGYTPDSEWLDKLGSHYGLHSTTSFAKRLAKAPPAPTPELNRDIRALIAATAPVASLVADLKSKVVKGRKPNPDVVAKKAAVAASRVGRDGECQICQHRQILTSDGKLVLHGYRRPGHGSIVGDCFGVGSPPWEVSCDALAAYVVELRRAAAAEAQAAKDAAKLTKITVNRGSVRNPRFVEMTDGTPREPPFRTFAEERERRVEGHLRQSKMLTEAAASEERRLKTWKPAKGA